MFMRAAGFLRSALQCALHSAIHVTYHTTPTPEGSVLCDFLGYSNISTEVHTVTSKKISDRQVVLLQKRVASHPDTDTRTHTALTSRHQASHQGGKPGT